MSPLSNYYWNEDLSKYMISCYAINIFKTILDNYWYNMSFKIDFLAQLNFKEYPLYKSLEIYTDARYLLTN